METSDPHSTMGHFLCDRYGDVNPPELPQGPGDPHWVSSGTSSAEEVYNQLL
jgi:hypothetical protein